MREFIRPAAITFSIVCLAASLAVLSTGSALAQAKGGQMAPAQAGPPAAQAPASGRLAAAIATISASRRRIRHGAERSNERTRRIRPFLPRRPSCFRNGAIDKMAVRKSEVETAAKIAMRPSR